jgi:hypothetical protein
MVGFVDLSALAKDGTAFAVAQQHWPASLGVLTVLISVYSAV